MHYYHTDHLNSTTVVTDQNGLEVEEMGYLPFGALLYDNALQGGQWKSVYRFTGQEYDAEFALYNYNARLYDPIMGRFISPDHIMQDFYNPQGLNRYAYCVNNPLIYVDPTGHLFGIDFGGFFSSIGRGISSAWGSVKGGISRTWNSIFGGRGSNSGSSLGQNIINPDSSPRVASTGSMANTQVPLVTPGAGLDGITSYNDFLDPDILWRSRADYGEFRGYGDIYSESLQNIITNRLKTGRWGNTVENVVTAHDTKGVYQFTCFNEFLNPAYERMMQGNINDKAMNIAIKRVINFQNLPESTKNPIPGVINYYSPAGMKPPGSVPYWAKNMETVKIKGIDPWFMTILK
jgi:RHS repeat-associated protein